MNWKVGDKIVVSISGTNTNEFETRYIKAISQDLKTLTLDVPLYYNHYGGTLTYDSKNFEIRTEVAVFTRQIVI